MIEDLPLQLFSFLNKFMQKSFKIQAIFNVVDNCLDNLSSQNFFLSSSPHHYLWQLYAIPWFLTMFTREYFFPLIKCSCISLA